MTDNNTIDITNRLPPIEVRKSWRQGLPNYHVGRLDQLKADYNDVRRVLRSLKSIREEFSEAAEQSIRPFEAEHLVADIAAAIVLLEFAEGKIYPLCRWKKSCRQRS